MKKLLTVFQKLNEKNDSILIETKLTSLMLHKKTISSN